MLFYNKLETGGGGEGTTNYNDLSNKPRINGVTLQGNKTTHNLGLFEQVTTMPSASSDYANIVVQYLGTSTMDYEQGNFYICEEQAGTYSWNHFQVEQIATNTDFGLVKVDNSSIIANGGVISANKATGNYSVSFVGNPATTTSALNVGANSTAHGWYATAIGCDAVVGDSTNDVRTAGAIQLGRGSNTEAGTFKVGLSTNGSTWNNYKIIDSEGKIPYEMTRETVTDTTSTTITLATAKAGTDYIYGTLTSLTVTAVDDSTNETTIMFTAGSGITVSLPASLTLVGTAPTYTATKKYIIAIYKSLYVVGEA